MTPDLFKRLSALSEPTRVRLLQLLAREELGVGELSRILQTPQSTISRHLKQLQTEGWLERRAEGTASFFRVAEPLPEASAALWAVVAAELAEEGLYAEDLHRLEGVLAQRELDSRAFFGRHAEHWSQRRQELFGDAYLLPTLLALLPPGLTIADLGCGTGEVLVALAPVAGRVIGVDREARMLEVAAGRAQGLCNVELREGGLEALPLDDGAVDLALCMLVLHHVEDPGAVLAEAARALAPGGRLVVLDMVEHTRREYRRTMGHRHLGFAEETLKRLATRAGLQVQTWRRLPADPEAQGPGLFVATLG
ncbi:MAG: metalloregulator ArsR/SmtB family transcription factor [Alphaproteobacteria bacterium]|nr:metalloregulator ArsR/SmtB family transcription factor [Alphaproteobacteria bacterium]